MKIVIGYPPLKSEKGVPLLSQNRQFQWFHNPIYIYPIVPAYAATMLKKVGHKVLWLDGISEGWSYDTWLKKVMDAKPGMVVIETKTPVVKRHWKIVDELKTKDQRLKTILVGDHVTALPEETMRSCSVDYLLTGGDYDFLLLNLVNHLEKGEKLEPGIWFREKSKIKTTGKFILNHDLNLLPDIDRDLTKWKLYAYEAGNYKKMPGTYIMAGRDCWWRNKGGCKFCAWTILYPVYRVRKVEGVLDEIGELIEKYKVREIMDDTGTFPGGEWLKEFCLGMIKRGYCQKIAFSCNLRAGVLSQEDYDLMAEAGFRMLLYGLESANQETLDRINKGVKAGVIAKDCQMAKLANKINNGSLEPHLTIMLGYPWEDRQEAENTVQMGRDLLKKGLADTLQATVVIPYPGTALFAECKAKNLLRTLDWEEYDMSHPVMKTSIKDEELKKMVQFLYGVAFSPEFILRRILAVRDFDDIKYFLKGGKAILGHLTDFARK